MEFSDFREQQIGEGKVKFQEKCDGWDPVHTPHKVAKPEFVRHCGKVFQVVNGTLIPLHKSSK